MDETQLKLEIYKNKRLIGKLHAEACLHRRNRDSRMMNEIHREIHKKEAEIKECLWLIDWVHVNGNDAL